jgi:ABC-type antimicrobial peptide transport system permease subunit
VVSQLVRRGLALILVGIAIGLLGAVLSTKMLTDLLFGVSPLDPVTFIAVSMLLAVVGIVAVFLPAFRASRLDPATVLRNP